MAVSCSSAGNSAMKASLVLMLLFGAVVAAHARNVTVVNEVCVPIMVNGVDITGTAILDIIDNLLMVNVTDVVGTVVGSVVMLPPGVTEVVMTYANGLLQLKVAAVTDLVGGLLNNLIGFLLDVVSVLLGC